MTKTEWIVNATSEPLFKIDSKNKTRMWQAEVGFNGEKWGWRTISGLIDGKKVTSEWTIVSEKNVGKANATTLEQQAFSEMNSEITNKKEKGYFQKQEDINTFDKFKPMLAEKFEDVTVNIGKDIIYSQPKLDGIRCIARSDGLWTREGKQHLSVPHIMDYLKPIFENNPDLILDGELYNHELKDDFNKIASLVRKTKPTVSDIEESASLVQYHVYDAFIKNNTNLSFSKRMEILKKLDMKSPVVYVETEIVPNKEQLDCSYENYMELGYEGQMIRFDMPYQNKRSKYLLKRKEFITEEFPVVELMEGLGNWSGCIKHMVIQLPDGRTCKCGVKGSREVLKKMFEEKYTPDWVSVRYFKPTPDNIPRFPIAYDWGKGKRND
jgi:DNA ligase-1